ncbi:sigma-E factor regulatory protein RseB [Shewanella sp. NFH-SH190041]|uniref:MucB/RseB C-terminal domain-containing protein n=1 Tax=Shewanella sp. NFH-SH190041 TaxID=2950245 RepID=UPI0021C42C56|nr:MucB/RseB C-terminal domain-containing protein [Shewanella sp. NFH-SH190041]BDM63624.1 sigma-E factor regulatory protein RseB [Shewanella sp. NFH-SH190041]
MRLILLALLAVVFPAMAQEELSAKAWLEHMSQALQQKQFKVSMIHLQADHIRPLVYLHGKVDGQDVAFLEDLNGPPKNAVRIGHTVTFLEHDQPAYSVRSDRIQGVWPPALAGNITALESGYEFVLGGRSRIAGRPGQMVRIMPKDGSRYIHQVWIDMESFLPLKYDLLTQDKQLIEQVMAVELVVLPEAPALLKEALHQDWPAVMNTAERGDGRNWHFSWLPDGFKVTVRDHHRLIGSHEAVEYVALSDGLANASVYIARASDTPLPEEVITRNGLSLVTEINGNAEIVVMGKLPPETLRRIARSLRLD